MSKFPADRVYRRKRYGIWRSLLIAFLLAAMFLAAWFYAVWTDRRQSVDVSGQKIYVIDGDSFTVGRQALRLDGIDAPELKQTCRDAKGQDWPCGRVARAALEALLLAPGLACEAEASDRYARALAHCRSTATPDIAAAQALGGMALSHEFNGMRDYGKEEDAARRAGLGIWQGVFEHPDQWRAKHPRNGQNP